ncbi:efflux RND transporter periplasmic adaptor subunit [Halalkalibacter urbisdiaboli]|uniref:efflux RND transporter periplasmic adaptor subunit n=1 Tax=Halalkalibacter urbisdiaboli TaxID=1960589 RepID=UPI0013FE2309|nr:efflux RND transporter periplasmic adaptor subunit [Halalkalibacter urbisdiaboli]
MKKVTMLDVVKFFSVIVLLTVMGCSQTEDATVDVVQETPVAVASAVTGSLSGTNQLYGEIVAGSTIDITPKVTGEVVEVLVKKGDKVEKGQVLARVDHSAQEQALKMEKATLKQAESAYQRAKNGLVQAEGNYKQALASKKQAEASLKEAKQGRQHNIDNVAIELKNAEKQLKEAKNNVERMKELFDAGQITRAEYEEAVAVRQRAQSAYDQLQLSMNQASSELSIDSVTASVEQAEVGVELAQASVTDAELSVNDAKVSLEQAQLSVDNAEDSLGDYQIKAPMSGELASFDVQVGGFASTQSPIGRLISTSVVHAVAQVTAEQLLLFEIGDSIAVDVAGITEDIQGEVSYISPTTNESGLFTVEVDIQNDVSNIRPGMVATLTIEEILVEDSMIIPTKSIVERQEETFIFVVEGDQVVRKLIDVVWYDTEFTAVTGDIVDGDVVVTKGQNLLDDGDLVRIIEEDK